MVLALVLGSAFFSPSASAEPSVILFEVNAPSRLTVGDHFQYIITLEAEAGTEITLAPGALPAELSLITAPEMASQPAGEGRSAITIKLEVAAFAPGQIEVTPLRLSYTEPSGAAGDILTPASAIEVTSVLPSSGDAEPRDLKPQAALGNSSLLTPALISLAGILAVLVIFALLVRFLNQRRLRKQSLAVFFSAGGEAEEHDPEDRARAVLDKASLEFTDTQDFVSYYGAIALAIRNYLTERYGFPAFALTTGELDREMQRRGIDRWQTRLVNGLLSQCDASVYAHYAPALERADADLTSAYEIVEMSRPALATPEEAPVA